jgi:hypothetical protein
MWVLDGDIIEFADQETSLLIQELFGAYANHLDLTRPFDPSKWLKDENDIQVDISQAYIETKELCHIFNTPIAILLSKENGKINVEGTGVPNWNTYNVGSELEVEDTVEELQ